MTVVAAAAIIVSPILGLSSTDHLFAREVLLAIDMETAEALVDRALEELAPSGSVSATDTGSVIERSIFVPRVARLVGELVAVRLTTDGRGVLARISSRSTIPALFDRGVNEANVAEVGSFLERG